MSSCNGCVYARERGSCVMCAHPVTREERALITPWEGGESAAMTYPATGEGISTDPRKSRNPTIDAAIPGLTSSQGSKPARCPSVIIAIPTEKTRMLKNRLNIAT